MIPSSKVQNFELLKTLNKIANKFNDLKLLNLYKQMMGFKILNPII
jgi:hypothetical protein